MKWGRGARSFGCLTLCRVLRLQYHETAHFSVTDVPCEVLECSSRGEAWRGGGQRSSCRTLFRGLFQTNPQQTAEASQPSFRKPLETEKQTLAPQLTHAPRIWRCVWKWAFWSGQLTMAMQVGQAQSVRKAGSANHLRAARHASALPPVAPPTHTADILSSEGDWILEGAARAREGPPREGGRARERVRLSPSQLGA